jgi:ABC-type glycerol-3-phosphate transport system substrate-binding protein
VKAALSDPYFQQGQRGDLLVKARQVSASQLQSLQTTYPLKPNQSAINETVDYYVQSALLGKLSPESALKKAQEQVQASSSR